MSVGLVLYYRMANLPAWLAVLGGSGPFPIAHRWRCGHRLDCRQLKDIGKLSPVMGLVNYRGAFLPTPLRRSCSSRVIIEPPLAPL